jgi:hypothetical protein
VYGRKCEPEMKKKKTEEDGIARKWLQVLSHSFCPELQQEIKRRLNRMIMDSVCIPFP